MTNDAKRHAIVFSFLRSLIIRFTCLAPANPSILGKKSVELYVLATNGSVVIGGAVVLAKRRPYGVGYADSTLIF